MFYIVVYASPTEPPPHTIYVYHEIPAGSLQQVKALCQKSEINSEQLEK